MRSHAIRYTTRDPIGPMDNTAEGEALIEELFGSVDWKVAYEHAVEERWRLLPIIIECVCVLNPHLSLLEILSDLVDVEILSHGYIERNFDFPPGYFRDVQCLRRRSVLAGASGNARIPKLPNWS